MLIWLQYNIYAAFDIEYLLSEHAITYKIYN